MKKQTLKTKLLLHRETLHALDRHAIAAAVGATGNTCLHNLCYTQPSACPQNCKP